MTHRNTCWRPGFGLAFLTLLSLPCLGAAQYQEPPPPAAYALQNITLVHPDGRRETGFNVVVREGLISDIGPGVEIPADAPVLEGDSLWVYPGLVDAQGAAELDLPVLESGASVLSWHPTREAQGFTPHRRAAEYLVQRGAEFRAERNAGVVAAGIHPRGGMAPGQSAAVLYRVTSEIPLELVVRPSIGLLFSFQGAGSVYPSSLFAVIAHFRQMFEDAGYYSLLRSEYDRDPHGMTSPAWDPDFEVLVEAASGSLPVFFLADDDEDIRRVLSLASEIGFRPVIVGGEEAWQVADQLASRDVPVLVSTAFPAPRDWTPPARGSEGAMSAGPDDTLEPAAAREKARLEDAYSNAGRLVAAGVRVALTSGGGEAEILEGARMAIEYGMSETDALAAITTEPASILGIPQVVVFEKGMAANFVVTDGPIFDEGTRILYTFVEGEMEQGRERRAAGEGAEPTVDVTGTWEVMVSAQGMELPFTMTLTQEGSYFSGNMENPEMGQAEIEGEVSGNTLNFTMLFSMGTESMEMESTATVEGDAMSGSGSGEVGTFTFTANRRPGSEGGIR